MKLQEDIGRIKEEYEREYILYRAVGLDEAIKSCKTGHLVYYSRDPMSRDWEVIEYGLGSYASEMSDEEVDEYVNELVPWTPNGKGVNLTSDLDNAKGYSDIVLEINLVGYDYVEFSDVHIFAKNPDDCKIKSVYYNGKEYTKEGFLDITKSLQEDIIRIKEVMGIISEEKIPATPKDLIKNLPAELKDLFFKQWGAKQNPKHHPEGNTLKHIIVVLKRAYHHYPDDPNMIMVALFHDLGKMDTYAINPKTGEPTAYGHENNSTEYVEKYREWIEQFDGVDVDEVKYLVQNHMKVKPSTWDVMKDTKKEPIMSHPAFDKLIRFTNKLDGGGIDMEK